jgi:putative endonuclease
MLCHPERSEGSRAVLRALRALSYYVYIMSSKSGVLYIGATNDLDRRMFEHKQALIEGFTKKYRVKRLVYVEQFDRAAEMVARERQLKGWTRSRKLELIHSQKSRNGGLRAEDRARSFAPAAAAQDDSRGES